jgi:hypothetical protein
MSERRSAYAMGESDNSLRARAAEAARRAAEQREADVERCERNRSACLKHDRWTDLSINNLVDFRTAVEYEQKKQDLHQKRTATVSQRPAGCLTVLPVVGLVLIQAARMGLRAWL